MIYLQQMVYNRKLICVLLLLLSVKSYAQYPFEKYPAIKYDSVSIVNHGTEYHKGFLTTHKKGFRRIATYKSYKLVFLCDSDTLQDGTNALLYHNGRIIKHMKLEVSIDDDWFQTPLFIGDIDGNGLPDFKIIIGNNGNGFAASYETKVYLLNQGNDKFKLISFMDLFENTERDFDHDGSYNIIGEEYRAYREHAYLIFNLYKFKHGKLINVSKKYNYPIAVPYLYTETYKATNKIPRRVMKKFLFAQPGVDHKN